MENVNIKDFTSVWKALLVIATIVAAVFAVDTRYVSDTVFIEFKEGTVASISGRLDRIETKLDALLAEKRK